jgi:hypothetical protein
MELYGGKNSAINAVAQNATSFGRRNAMWTIQLYASSPTYNPPFPGYGFPFLDGKADRYFLVAMPGIFPPRHGKQYHEQ